MKKLRHAVLRLLDGVDGEDHRLQINIARRARDYFQEHGLERDVDHERVIRDLLHQVAILNGERDGSCDLIACARCQRTLWRFDPPAKACTVMKAAGLIAAAFGIPIPEPGTPIRCPLCGADRLATLKDLGALVLYPAPAPPPERFPDVPDVIEDHEVHDVQPPAPSPQ